MTDILICWRGDCRGAAMPAMLWPGHLATTHPTKEEPVTNQPDDMPPFRHIENAEMLLRQAEPVSGPGNSLLAALAHAVIAIAKMMGKQREYRW